MIESVDKKAIDMAEQKGQIEASALRDKILNELDQTEFYAFVSTHEQIIDLGAGTGKNQKRWKPLGQSVPIGCGVNVRRGTEQAVRSGGDRISASKGGKVKLRIALRNL
jgi:hypothetical protein